LFEKRPIKVRAQTPNTDGQRPGRKEVGMLPPEMDDIDVERMIDIIGDGELTSEVREKLHREGLWPLYESPRQTAYAAFVFGRQNG
jgi:hypothetical protein